MAEFKRGDTCYILKNNKYPVRAKVAAKSGNLYTIQMVGSNGAIRLSEHRLFSSEEEALEGKIIEESSDQTGTVDIFAGKRVKINKHILD